MSSSWWYRRQRQPAVPGRRAARPAVEALEPRFVPAPLIQTQLPGGPLGVEGLALAAGAPVKVSVFVVQQDQLDHKSNPAIPVVPGFAGRFARIQDAVNEINSLGLGVELLPPQMSDTPTPTQTGPAIVIQDQSFPLAGHESDFADTNPRKLGLGNSTLDRVPYYAAPFARTLVPREHNENGVRVQINWYTGTAQDTTALGAGRDYETTLTHELGHALGLQHYNRLPILDAKSPMNTTGLNGRPFRRYYSQNDLDGLQYLYSSFYVTDTQGGIFSINPLTGDTVNRGTARPGNAPVALFDLAMDPAGRFYGVDGNTGSSKLYALTLTPDADPGDGPYRTHVGSDTGMPLMNGVNPVFVNALEFSPRGTLFAAGNNKIYTINPATGAATLKVQLDANYQSAGDIAFDDQDTLYLTTRDGSLFRIANADTSASPITIRATNVNDLLGLVNGNDGYFYGFSNSQRAVYRIDPDSGMANKVADAPSLQGINGATAFRRPQFAPPIAGGGVLPDSSTSIAAFDPATGTWYQRNENSAGAPDAGRFAYGGVGWMPVVGSWTFGSNSSVGVVDPQTATWYLRNENSAGAPDVTAPFAYGAKGWSPVAGDWTASGHSGVGMFDPATATWYLRSSAGAGVPDIKPFQFGAPGWIPVVGDWDGNGTYTIGVVDPATMTWYLRNSNTPGVPDVAPFQYGGTGWKPVVGDWDGNGRTSIAVVDPKGSWYIRNNNGAGAPDIAPFAYGAGGWIPVGGKWQAPPTLDMPGEDDVPDAPGAGGSRAVGHAVPSPLPTAAVTTAAIPRLAAAVDPVGTLADATPGGTSAGDNRVAEAADSAHRDSSPAKGANEAGGLTEERDTATAGNDLMSDALGGRHSTDALDRVFAAGA